MRNLIILLFLISTLPQIQSSDVPYRNFFLNFDNTPASLIVVGERASSSGIISSTLVAAKIGEMAVTEKEKILVKTFTADVLNIPLAYRLSDYPVPEIIYNVSGTPIESTISSYKTWGVTTFYTHDANPYSSVNGENFMYLDGVKVEYSLHPLWFFDDEYGIYGDGDYIFDTWETHEEIQIRFDDLYSKVFRLSGVHHQDHLADLSGGDFEMLTPSLIYRIDNVRVPPQIEVDGLFASYDYTHVVDLHSYQRQTFSIPNPYYISNDFLPRIYLFGREYRVISAISYISPEILDDCNDYLDESLWISSPNVTLSNSSDAILEESMLISVSDAFTTGVLAYSNLGLKNFSPYESLSLWIKSSVSTSLGGLQLVLSENIDLSTEDEVLNLPALSANTWTYVTLIFSGNSLSYDTIQSMSFKLNTDFGTQEIRLDEISLDKREVLQLTLGNPHLEEIYMYVDVPQRVGYYLITLKDVDIDHNKAHLNISTPLGVFDFWMILDPEHGFSPTLQKQGPTGGTRYTGLSLNDIWGISSMTTESARVLGLTYFGDPNFIIDGVSIFESEKTLGVLFYIYWVEDMLILSNKNCCSPFVKFPNEYSLNIQTHRANIQGSRFDLNASAEIIPHVLNSQEKYFDDLDGDNITDYLYELNFGLCESLLGGSSQLLKGPNYYFEIEILNADFSDADEKIHFRVSKDKKYFEVKERILKLKIQDLIKLDSEITREDKKEFNLILIGNSHTNLLVQELVDFGIRPDDHSEIDWFLREWDYKLYTDPWGFGKSILVIAGYDPTATRMAVIEFVSRL